MSERFSDSLRATATPIWDAIFRHPFLSQLGAGTLAEETFRFYICQDYHFLEGFARTVAIALSKAPDSEALLLLSKRVPVPIERELHRSLFSMLEMDVSDAEGMEPAPTNRAYINHLLSTATLGSVGDAAAALLPCPWTYHEIGQQLGQTEHPIYKSWASVYQQGFLAESVEAWRLLLDRAAADAGEAQRRRMQDAFLTSSRYEYMFWEMAYQRETWPL